MSDEELITILRDRADYLDHTPSGQKSLAVRLRLAADRLEALTAEREILDKRNFLWQTRWDTVYAALYGLLCGRGGGAKMGKNLFISGKT